MIHSFCPSGQDNTDTYIIPANYGRLIEFFTKNSENLTFVKNFVKLHHRRIRSLCN